MKYLKIFIYSFVIAFGAFLFVYGGYDDSPGGQLLGAVLAIIGIVFIYTSIRKK